MKNLRILFVLLMVFSLVFISCSKKEAEEQVSEKILKAKVTLVQGTAYILREDQPSKKELNIGDRILPNDVIITGKKSAVNVVIVNRGIFKIKDDSNVSLKNLINVGDDENHAGIKVTAGRIVLGLQKLKKNSSFEVETPTAVAGVRGTSFMVSVSQEEQSAFPYFVKIKKKENIVTKIAVLTGSVELSNPANAKEKYMISALKQATLRNDDFKNVKIEKITRLYMNEIAAIKDYSEVKELQLNDITDEIKSAEPAIDELIKADLKTKSEIKSKIEDLSATEKAIENQQIEAKKEAIKKMKAAENKSEGKYLEDENGW